MSFERSFVVAIAFALMPLCVGCCSGVPEGAVHDAAKHMSDTAEAGRAAQAVCKSPPAGQDPAQVAQLCAKVDEAFDEIKKTSDSLDKSAQQQMRRQP